IATSTKNVKDKKDKDYIYKEHHDLKSFLALKDVNKNTPVYHDFRGQWILPDKRLCVIGQYKALAKKCSPNIIRELESVLVRKLKEHYAFYHNGRKLGSISWNKAAEEYLKGFQ
ncbi:8421_t:CDS:2, partial [Cetraspora pellucida]